MKRLLILKSDILEALKKLGNATLRFMRQRDLVDFAVKWIESNRK